MMHFETKAEASCNMVRVDIMQKLTSRMKYCSVNLSEWFVGSGTRGRTSQGLKGMWAGHWYAVRYGD